MSVEQLIRVAILLSIILIVLSLRPTFAARASPVAGKVGTLLLVVASLPTLVKMWPAMISLIGDSTLLAIVAFVAVGLAVGHLVGTLVSAPYVRWRRCIAAAPDAAHTR